MEWKGNLKSLEDAEELTKKSIIFWLKLNNF